jgi:hypothetical protein
MVEVVLSFETSAYSYETTRRHILESYHLHTHCHENMKCHCPYYLSALESITKADVAPGIGKFENPHIERTTMAVIGKWVMTLPSHHRGRVSRTSSVITRQTVSR